MPDKRNPQAKGRGAQIKPANRFEQTHYESDWEQLDDDDDYLDSLKHIATQYIPDESKSIVSEHDSPDVSFRYTVNAYRGCSHGCVYCYARPTHEYLGMDAGIDFEAKVLVKEQAPKLFRDFLAQESWVPEWIVFSGVTDCYQPAERKFKLTRGCLEVALEARQPVGIITKNALISRDLDLLTPMAELNTVNVAISITTLDAELARTMEPRTSTPPAKLRTISEL